LRKVANKLRAFSAKTDIEEFKRSLTHMTDRENFNKTKAALIQNLKESGSEVKFLQHRKSIELQNIKTAQVNKKSSRAIASNYPSFEEIFTYTAILGLTAYGIITLAAIGSVLAITGLVILGIIGLVLLLMGLSCILQMTCSLPTKQTDLLVS
jgi:type III secretory pathway component EscR